MGLTKIEWCTHSANPFHGCRHGCSYCYARDFARRLSHMLPDSGYGWLRQHGHDPFEPFFDVPAYRKLDHELVRARKPRRVFLGSMGDIGGDWPYHIYEGTVLGLNANRRLTYVSHSHVISAVLSLIERHPRHTFLVLTKAPSNLAPEMRISSRALHNLHLGVSAGGRKMAAKRLGVLLGQFPQPGIRWISVEPLQDPGLRSLDTGDGWPDWVVIGGMKGEVPSAECTAAAQRLVVWCRERGIPCFTKDNMIAGEPGWDWPLELPRRPR